MTEEEGIVQTCLMCGKDYRQKGPAGWGKCDDCFFRLLDAETKDAAAWIEEQSKRTVTVIAKGPSAEHAADWIADVPSDVATINESGQLIPGVNIDFAFFTHIEFGRGFQSEDWRIGRYVCPDLLTHETANPPEWMIPKLTQYADRECVGDEESLLARIVEGGICHHNTVNGALHWLAKHGKYERIRIIGVDGGRSYAGNLKAISPIIHERIVTNEGTDDYFDRWKQVTETLCGVLSRVYGTEFIWWNP